MGRVDNEYRALQDLENTPRRDEQKLYLWNRCWTVCKETLKSYRIYSIFENKPNSTYYGLELRGLYAAAGLILLTFAEFGFAQSTAKNGVQSASVEIKQLQQQAKNMSDDLVILRRDQLNYKIEKDLLKEAYASNLQSVNLIITIVLGMVTIVGGLFAYFGIRSLRDLKEDYKKDLEGLRQLKTSVESGLSDLQEQQKRIVAEIKSLAEDNEKQDNRLKVLELTEKASEYIRSRQHKWALEYINAGLTIEPKNRVLLNQKATCHGKLGEYSACIQSYRQVIKEYPEDTFSEACNLAEALAIAGEVVEMDALCESKKEQFDTRYDGKLILWLRALSAIRLNDKAKLREVLNGMLQKCPEEPLDHLQGWGYDEARVLFHGLQDPVLKHAGEMTARFFGGQAGKKDLETVIAGLA